MEKGWRQSISDQTFVSFSVAIALASFAFWLSTLQANTTSNTKSIDEIYVESREQDVMLRDVTSRLARIEGKLDQLRQDRKR